MLAMALCFIGWHNITFQTQTNDNTQQVIALYSVYYASWWAILDIGAVTILGIMKVYTTQTALMNRTTALSLSIHSQLSVTNDTNWTLLLGNCRKPTGSLS